MRGRNGPTALGAQARLGQSRCGRRRVGDDVVAATAHPGNRATAVDTAGTDPCLSGAAARATAGAAGDRREPRAGYAAAVRPTAGMANGLATEASRRSHHPVEPGCAQLHLAVAAERLRLNAEVSMSPRAA